MATLVKTGIGDGQTLTPVIITELYDAFTGDKLFDNIVFNNSMKVTHDGKVSISRPGFGKPTTYALTVDGDIKGNVGRFDSVISDTMTFVTSSGLIVSGSNHFGGLDTHIHTFTGSLAISGSQAISNYFLNKVAIGRIDVTEDHMFEVVGGAKISTYVSASDLHIDETGSFGHLKVSGDAIINGNLTFGNSDTDSVSFGAEINSHIIPNNNNSVDLGSSAKYWSRGYITTMNVSNLSAASTVTSEYLTLNDSGFKANTALSSPFISGSLTSTGSFGRIEVGENLKVNNTASFQHLEVEQLLTINTASFGDTSISKLSISGQTGSESQLVKTVDGVLSFDWADRTSIVGKNMSGGTLGAGSPVYIFSFVDSADVYGVDVANSNVESRRPAIGITLESLAYEETGSIIISGVARSSALDTSGFANGANLFLGANALTSVKPTSPGQAVQVVGVCLKSSATDGEILITTGGGGGGSTEILKVDNILLGSGSLTQNIHLSGAFDRATLNDVTALGTGSFGHLIIDGNITASGTVRADTFESVTGGDSIDFKDSLNITGNLTASGDLSIDDLTASGRITALDYGGNVSGSLTSTGSFGYGLFDQRVGIGIKDPSSILHISGTDGLIIPVGTDAQRNSAPKQGEIRFNIDQTTYEGYDGANWGSLGGMNDVDQDTKITAETSAGADNDELTFFTAGTERLRILADGHISASGNITSSGNLKILGNISSSTLTVSAASTASTAITTNNITNGYPTSNNWQQNLEGSFFNNFDNTTHVSEILRFMAGVLSSSLDVADASPNTKNWSSVSTTHTDGSTTSKNALLDGVLGSTYENARLSAHWTSSAFIDTNETQSYKLVQNYLLSKGWLQTSDRGDFGNDTGTNPFHGSYASRIPSTILTNGTFDTNTFTISANAGGSTAVSSNSNYFGLGTLTSGGATAYSVRILASASFSDNYSDSTPDKNSTFHTSSFIDYTISDFGTSNGLILSKIVTNQPAVIPSAFQDGDFNNVAGPLSGRFHHTGSQEQNTISASGYYVMDDIQVGLKSGSMSDFQYKDGSDGTTYFYLYTGDLPSDITSGAPSAVVSRTNEQRTLFNATSRSLSGAPYLLTTNYHISYSAEVSRSFDPAFAYATTVMTNSNPTDNWETVGSTTISNTTVSINSSGVNTNNAGIRGVVSEDRATQRGVGDIPHVTDIVYCSSSFEFSLDSNSSNVVQNRSSQEDLNYTLSFRTVGKNWKNSSTTVTGVTTNLYTASLYSQPASSGSMAIYSRAQGYDSNTLADNTETFTGEDFRIVLADNVQAFNGSYFTTDSFKTNDNGDSVLGDYDLQVKPGYLVDPGGTKGYWFAENFGSGTYKYYIRRFQKSSGGTKTSMTINLSNTTLVAWNSTSNGVACAILFESSGNGSGNNSSLSRARIFDPTATTSNVIEENISNDNHKNPFSTAIDLYGNTGGSISSNTYTIPIRNADGMFLDDSDNELYVLVRYKSDPTPITSITLSYS